MVNSDPFWPNLEGNKPLFPKSLEKPFFEEFGQNLIEKKLPLVKTHIKRRVKKLYKDEPEGKVKKKTGPKKREKKLQQKWIRTLYDSKKKKQTVMTPLQQRQITTVGTLLSRENTVKYHAKGDSVYLGEDGVAERSRKERTVQGIDQFSMRKYSSRMHPVYHFEIRFIGPEEWV